VRTWNLIFWHLYRIWYNWDKSLGWCRKGENTEGCIAPKWISFDLSKLLE
jgi:hypothetical protein